MSKYITYEQWLKDGGSIKDIVDDSLAQAIEDWFFDRKIGWEDSSKFDRYLHRNISVNLSRYHELLRIQPGVSDFDWLIQSCKKAVQTVKENGENTKIHENDTTTFTADMYKYDNGLKEIVIHRNNDVVDTSIRSGNEEHNKTGGHSSTRSGNEDTILTGGHDNTRSGSQENVKTGGHTTTDVQGIHTQEVSPHVGTKTQNGGHTSEWSGNKTVSSVNPMSKSYSKFVSPAELKDSETPETQEGYFRSRAEDGLPVDLNWETLSQQGQDSHNGYSVDKTNTETSYVYGSDKKGDITETKGDAKNPDTSEIKYNNEKDVTTYDGVKDTVHYNDETNTHNYNDVTDKFAYDESGEKDTTTYNDVQDKTQHDGYITQTAPHDNGTNVTENAYGNITDKNENNSKTNNEEQGRNEAPADILNRAVRFIERTNAFEWLRNQIDCCFLADLED